MNSGKIASIRSASGGERILGTERDVAVDILNACSDGPANRALAAFNRHFASRPLTRLELRLFFSSIAAFNRYTVAGIAILAGRLSDQVLPLRPLNGHEIGACVLDAAIDEYGLRDGVTHPELAQRMAQFLHISAVEMNSRQLASPASVRLGDALFAFYREQATAFSLGVHTASEVTSSQEFSCWHDVFLSFPEYQMSQDLPEFEYMRAHYAKEPGHAGDASICVSRYLQVFPDQAATIRRGAAAYLGLYEEMFLELDRLIFH